MLADKAYITCDSRGFLKNENVWWFWAIARFAHSRILLLLIWQSPGLPGWRKVNLITVTRRPLQPSIHVAAGFYRLTTSPGFLPALCEKWSGLCYVHTCRVWLPYTRDRQLKVSSERLGNEDKALCPRALSTAGPGFEPGSSGIEVRDLNRSATTAPYYK